MEPLESQINEWRTFVGQLFVSLAGTAWLAGRFLTGSDSFHRLERWQTSHLHLLGLWAASVVVILPPLFAFA